MHKNRLSNHTVYARVRVIDGIMYEHIKNSFKDNRWIFEPVDVAENTYIVAIPLYCAKVVALAEARSEIADFGKRNLPLITDELRLLAPPRDSRRRVAVARIAGGWLGFVPERIRRSREVPLGRLHWEVAVKREHENSPLRRRAREVLKARNTFLNSPLPGEKLNQNKMKLTTQSEPKTVHYDLWSEPFKLVKSLSSFMLAMLIILCGAVLPWLNVPVQLRIGGPLLALGLVVWVTLWATGDRLSPWVRGMMTLGVAAVVGILGFVISMGIASADGVALTFPGAGMLVLIAGVLIVVFSGWIHLAIRHPQVGVLWSLPFLTAIAAIAMAGAQFYIAMWVNNFGVPSGSLAIPAWFRVVVALYIVFWVSLAVVILGGLFGWCSYFGLSSGALFNRAVVQFLAVLVAVSWGLIAVGQAFSHTQNQVAEWRAMLADGETPVLTSEFLYRACFEAMSDETEMDSSSTAPQVVIQGEGESLWSWDVEHDSLSASAIEILNTDGVRVVRVPDGVSSCL